MRKELSKINVLLDHQTYTFQNYGGISRIFTELYKKFNSGNEISPKISILLTNNVYLKDLKNIHKIVVNNKAHITRIVIYILNRIFTTFQLIFTPYDIFQPTYYDPYFLNFIGKKPFLLVVYDLTHELVLHDDLSKKDKTIKWKRKLINKADKIVAISENTKKDIIDYYKIDASKIKVIHLANSLKLDTQNVKIDLPKKYLLFVGNRSKYKNFQFTVKSISSILKTNPNLHLVCAGGGSFNGEELQLFKSLEIGNKVKHIKFENDKELSSIYNHAIAFIFPSLYEGFGIPVLEAFACKCPAIISNTSSLPEVGGEAALYFNPTDEDSIQKAVKRILGNQSLRQDLITKGEKRLKLFNWDKVAKEYTETYKDLLENNSR